MAATSCNGETRRFQSHGRSARTEGESKRKIACTHSNTALVWFALVGEEIRNGSWHFVFETLGRVENPISCHRMPGKNGWEERDGEETGTSCMGLCRVACGGADASSSKPGKEQNRARARRDHHTAGSWVPVWHITCRLVRAWRSERSTTVVCLEAQKQWCTGRRFSRFSFGCEVE